MALPQDRDPQSVRHTFIKKTQKTPHRDLEIARTRLRAENRIAELEPLCGAKRRITGREISRAMGPD